MQTHDVLKIEPIKIVTQSRRLRMDCETPVSLFLKTAMEQPAAFILESVHHGEHSGRFSFIGWDPILHFSYIPGEFRIAGAINQKVETKEPISLLKQIMQNIDLHEARSIPNARGGLIGHIGYDAIRLIEDIGPIKPSKVPWIDLIMPRCLLVMDHLDHAVTLVTHQVVGSAGEDQARRQAAQNNDNVLRKIQTFSVASASFPLRQDPIDLDAWTSNLSKQEYCKMVQAAKDHIVEGDIFQVVLSRAIRRRFDGDPFEIYRVLRTINPSPYMFYLRQGDRVIVGGSPEALVTLEDGLLTTKPIAGTRPRGSSLNEDLQLEKDLLADEKERAEHVMLVDLGRNDLGKVAKYGSVSVPRYMQIERYSHVMHIVSVVEAQLRQDLHSIDALMSVFPAGTLSGAPKIRAMQIINNFEPEAREIYGGAIALLDFSGNMDSCIAIRTATYENGTVRVQAGAGIVADSVPETEYDETTHKMMSMVTAVERALQNLHG